MEEDELLDQEHVEEILSPHPLSFMGLQSLCIFLILWGLIFGWMVNFSDFSGHFINNALLQIAVWGLVLLVVSIIASIIKVLWRIFFLYLAVVLIALGLVIWLNLYDSASVFLPVYTVIVSIIGFLMVEWFRRSHKYIISNQRIVFKGGVITKEQRTLRYDKISDINTKQGIIGQIFGFGTIIPISQSGFGLGSDQSFAGGGVQGGATKKVGLFGFFGGGREVQTPRTRSYYELHGVYPFKDIKKVVENLVQGSVSTPYLQKQVEFQEEQRDFQEEQRDLQKEMRDLLKKQKELTQTSEEE